LVEVEPAFPNQAQSINVGGLIVPINGAAAILPGATVDAALIAMTDSDWNDVMGFWYTLIGSDEEFKLAKFWTSMCIKAYKRMPFYDSFTDEVINCRRSNTDNTNLRIPLANAATFRNDVGDSDWYNPLGVPSKSDVEVRNADPGINYSSTPAVMRGLLAFGLVERGTKRSNNSFWCWSAKDDDDLLVIADITAAVSDAMEQVRGMDILDVITAARNSWAATRLQQIRNELITFIEARIVGMKMSEEMGTEGLLSVRNGRLIANNTVRWLGKIPNINLPTLGFTTDTRFTMDNNAIWFGTGAGKGDAKKGFEWTKFNRSVGSGLLMQMNRNYDTSPELLWWLGWVNWELIEANRLLDTFTMTSDGADWGCIGSIIIPRLTVSNSIGFSNGYADAWAEAVGRRAIIASTAYCITQPIQDIQGALVPEDLTVSLTGAGATILNARSTWSAQVHNVVAQMEYYDPTDVSAAWREAQAPIVKPPVGNRSEDLRQAPTLGSELDEDNPQGTMEGQEEQK
jgi:hypothetical protein